MELDLPFSDQETSSENEESSVLEYAREQGICSDYSKELPSLVDIFSALRTKVDQDLRDPFDDDIANAATAAAELTKQKLTVTKDVVSLLKDVLALRNSPNDDPLATGGRQRIPDMKQELPVLQTDAELDMLNFGTRFEPDFRELRTRLPSEDVDEETDEGFGWPTKYFAYPAQCDAKIRSEKLSVTREVLTFLQNAVKDEYTAEDGEQLMAKELAGNRNAFTGYITPPLLPLSPPLAPYIPSSPANRLPLAPESEDSVIAEAQALERQIMADDSMTRHHSGSSDSMLLDAIGLDQLLEDGDAISPHFAERTPKMLKRRADDLKVEGPLTPPILSDSPMKKLKSVSFAKTIRVGDTFEPWTDDHSPGTSDTRDALDEFVKEIAPFANQAKRKVENEKLSGADTTARVEVPDIDLTTPMAPWNEYTLQQSGEQRHGGGSELKAQMRFLLHVKREELRTASAWRGISDLDLSWGWFASSSSTIKLNEKLHGEVEFNKIHVELTTAQIATSSNEVWKKDGLRLLDDDEDEDEEELEPAEIEARNDMEALIRKRKLELQDEEAAMEESGQRKRTVTDSLMTNSYTAPQSKGHGSQLWYTGPECAPAPDVLKESRTPVEPCSQRPPMAVSQHTSAREQKGAVTALMFGGSASTALHKFIESQGKSIKPASTASAEQKSKPLTSATPNASVFSQEPSAGQSLFVNQEPGSSTTVQIRQPLRCRPSLPQLHIPPCSMVVCSTLLQRRTLIKQIEQLSSDVELIYRDYALPHSPHVEADFCLSPSTGIILTTLMQIKQTPLPGQTARSLIKDRMTTLQARYERLIVLVSEGLSREMEEQGSSRPEDARDKETLKRLEHAATLLEGDVVVDYVHGGEQSLARSIAEHIARYSLPHGSQDLGDIKLLPIETTWEVFLRRAGLNPFAAQVIIASLKEPTPFPLTSLSSTCPVAKTVDVAGLTALLVMSHQDRVKRFQALMGGSRILDRVGKALDQGWISAVNGYRM